MRSSLWILRLPILQQLRYTASMNYLDNNSFMFCLLHEENHNRHPFRTASWFLLSSGILLLIPIFFHYSFESFIAFSIAVIFLGIVLKRKEEYECDEFASISLKNQIKIQEAPSQVIERTLKTMPYQRWWSTLIHPPHNKRVKNIADNVD